MTISTIGQATAFGRHMKRWRRQSGLSQLELAVRAGLSQRHVSFIETGLLDVSKSGTPICIDL
ncbi:MAG: helix-turn-helix transcriptional regulator [Chloroflexi bacterium]|nr:helix-turn-helix transcriptional regulator [Chloroflexota bacterium]